MAPAQNDLGIEFEALYGPVIVVTHKPESQRMSLMQRWRSFWSRLRHYG